MMKSLMISLFALFILITSVYSNEYEIGEYMVSLNDMTHDAVLKETGPTYVVKYFTTWCGHCKRLKPAWDELAENLADNEDVIVAEVNCEENSELCKEVDVDGYPTIYKWQGGKVTGAFSGPFEAAYFETWIDAKNFDATDDVTMLTLDNHADVLGDGETHIVLYTASWCPPCQDMKQAYVDTAENVKMDKVHFHAVECTQEGMVCAQMRLEGYPAVIKHLNGEEELFEGLRSAPKMQAWAKEEIEPNREEPRALEKPEEKKPEKKQKKQQKKKTTPPREVKPGEGHVQILTEQNFVEKTETGVWAVKFYAPWCGHCKQLAPKWVDLSNQFAEEETDVPVHIAEMDCTENKPVCEGLSITGYPTLKIFREGVPTDYSGQREVKDLHDTIMTMTGPVLTEVMTEQEYQKAVENTNHAIALFNPITKTQEQSFKQAAIKYKRMATFIMVRAPAPVAYEVGSTAMVAVSSHGILNDKLVGEINKNSIGDFMDLHSYPLVTKLDVKNFRNFVHQDRFTMIAALKKDQVNMEQRGKVDFGYLDADEYESFMMRYEFTGETPFFVMIEGGNEVHWPVPQNMHEKKMRDTMQAIFNGEVECFDDINKKWRGETKSAVEVNKAMGYTGTITRETVRKAKPTADIPTDEPAETPKKAKNTKPSKTQTHNTEESMTNDMMDSVMTTMSHPASIFVGGIAVTMASMFTFSAVKERLTPKPKRAAAMKKKKM